VSQTYGRHRRAAVLLAVLLAAVVTLLMVSAPGAWAGDEGCKSDTGYKVCAGPSAGGGGGDPGSAVGSAVVQGSAAGNADLPVTGTSPVRSIVIGAAFILVGAAAVVGSMQARRRTNPSY
jgi:hypothetical protein